MQNEKTHQLSSTMMKTLINPTIAAMLGFSPVYRLFEHKAAAQMGEKATPIPMSEIVKRSTASAPLIGGIVTVQVLTAQGAEAILKWSGVEHDIACKMLSALATGIASVHPLAALNYATSDKSEITPVERLKKSCSRAVANTSFKVGTCIALKETGFVAALIMGDSALPYLQPIIGDNKYAVIAITSSLAALATQPFDTMAVRMQNNLSTTAADLMRGGLYRGVAVAVFSCSYSYLKENMNTAVDRYM